jgi:arylsulfatase A
MHHNEDSIMASNTLSRRSFMRSAVAQTSAVALGASLAGCARSKSSRLPNIVYILADDMGYGDPQLNNPESKIPTPNMDRIGREGMRFTDAHSPSAVCTPTRYGLLTGRYCWRSRLKKSVLWGYSPSLIEPDRTTVPSFLRTHGYATAGVGKWHLGLGSEETTDYSKPLNPCPIDLGFDYFFGIPASLDMEPYLYVENDHATEQPIGEIEERDMPGFYRGGPIAPDFKHIEVMPTITGKAVGFIDDHMMSESESPFFLYFPLTAPHTPWLPTDDVVGKSKAGVYGDFVAQVDNTVGLVLDALDRHGIADNTLIILTSDNGADERYIDPEFRHEANGELRGQKADIWDGGHRIPFFARWPERIQAGSECDETICLTDLLATCVDLMGDTLPTNAGEDSYSILPALLGETSDSPIREATVHHSISGMFSIRQGDWKLVLGVGSGGFNVWNAEDDVPKPGESAGQLYNLADDYSETTNLYGERPDIVERMSALLEKYQSQGYSRQM